MESDGLLQHHLIKRSDEECFKRDETHDKVKLYCSQPRVGGQSEVEE